MDGFDEHIAYVANRLARGLVTPFLGAGANLCGRPRDYSWKLGDGYFPSGAELALHLADTFGYEEGDDPGDLMAVATYTELMMGKSPLYSELRDIFDRDVSPT
jgi:hypothetical protein